MRVHTIGDHAAECDCVCLRLRGRAANGARRLLAEPDRRGFGDGSGVSARRAGFSNRFFFLAILGALSHPAIAAFDSCNLMDAIAGFLF